MVYALPDQRTHCLVKILVEEIIPIFGVPKALLSDRGTNLLCWMCVQCWAYKSLIQQHTTHNVMGWWIDTTEH